MTPAQVAALTVSHSPDPVVETYTHGAPQARTRLPVGAGDVSWSAGSYDRATVTLDLPLEWAPTSWSDPLTPDDARLVISYGMGTDDAPIVVARLWVERVSVVRPDGRVTVTAGTLAARIAQAGFPDGDRRYSGPTIDVVGKIAADALGRPVSYRVEGALTAGGPTVRTDQTFTGDPWMAIEDLMDAAGGEAFFDETDELVLRPQPVVKGTPDWTLTVGAGGTVTGYTVDLERAPNVVRMAVQSTAGTADVVGTAQATGAARPDGPYGPYRTDVTRPGSMTKAQADAAAGAWLAREGGLGRTVTIQAVPHPGIVVGDTLAVTYANGATERCRVVGVRLPLTPGNAMTVEGKATPW
jgi:hypothetical protein